MVKESFLDTNVIVNFVNYQDGKSDETTTRCYSYIVKKQGKLTVCYAVIEELLNVIAKLAVLHREVLKKIEDESYALSKSARLSWRDVPLAEKLYTAYKDSDHTKLREAFASERDAFEIKTEQFLKNTVDLKVVPLEQIRTELVNVLRNIIENYADCRILASALQYKKEQQETLLFVTADKKDFHPNHYAFLQEHFEVNYAKEGYVFPELHNLAVVS